MTDTPLSLGIDASTPPSSVALLRGDRVLATRTGPFGRDTDAWILPAIDAVLEDAEVGLEDLDCIGTSVGPGTFTGIRVGIATALGLARGRDTPVGGIDTLQALLQSAPAGEAAAPLLALVDARRGQLYVAAEGEAPRLLTPDDLIVEIGGRPGMSGIGSGLDADPRLRQVLRPVEASEPVAAGVARLLGRAFSQRGAPGLNPPRPHYIRAPDAKVGRNPLAPRRRPL